MHNVQADFELNFIRVTIESILDFTEALQVIQEILLQIEMFKGRSFSFLLDFRRAEPFSPEVAEVWVDVARRARELGLLKSARLVSSPEMKSLVNRVARDAQNVELVRNFTDEQEAIQWLTTASSRRLVE